MAGETVLKTEEPGTNEPPMKSPYEPRSVSCGRAPGPRRTQTAYSNPQSTVGQPGSPGPGQTEADVSHSDDPRTPAARLPQRRCSPTRMTSVTGSVAAPAPPQRDKSLAAMCIRPLSRTRRFPPGRAANRSPCQALTAFSTARPNASTCSSVGPITCMDTIRPSGAGTGSDSAGSPARLTGAVSAVSGKPCPPSSGGGPSSVGQHEHGEVGEQRVERWRAPPPCRGPPPPGRRGSAGRRAPGCAARAG